MQYQSNPTQARIEAADSCDIRTMSGQWRHVVAVYTDSLDRNTYGTIRAEGNSSAGRFTLIEHAAVMEMRS